MAEQKSKVVGSGEYKYEFIPNWGKFPANLYNIAVRVDSQARVIGINTMIQTTSGGSMGLGFAIPINQVRPIAQTIIAQFAGAGQ